MYTSVSSHRHKYPPKLVELIRNCVECPIILYVGNLSHESFHLVGKENHSCLAITRNTEFVIDTQMS